MQPPSPSLAPSLALSHTHTVQLRQQRRRRWRRQRDSLLFSLRQKDLRPPCFCLDESATQRTPEAGPGTAEGSSKGKSQHSPSKQFLAGNNRLLSPLRAHLQCAANFTQSRAEREKREGAEGREGKGRNGYYRLFQDPGRRSSAPGLPLPPLLRLRLQLAQRLLTKWRRPWKRQPHFVPGRACQQNADLAKAEEQKAVARSHYRERREESEGFHRPPAAERRLSINACLMNKPAIRLMLQVTLSSTKVDIHPFHCLGARRGSTENSGAPALIPVPTAASDESYKAEDEALGGGTVLGSTAVTASHFTWNSLIS
nr:PREDICTED: uncharacterized protein LOC106488138 [Apteryx mantelli mantelli]